MDIKYKLGLLDCLTRILPESHVTGDEYGICSIAKVFIYAFGYEDGAYSYIDGLLRNSFVTWDGFSGSLDYPVEGCEWQHHAVGKWDLNTERGRKRHDLLDHVVDHLTQEYCRLLIEAI